MLERINLVPKKKKSKQTWLKAYGIMFVIFSFVFFSIYYKSLLLSKKAAAIESAINVSIQRQESIENLQARVKILQMEIDRKNEILSVLTGRTEKFLKVSDEKFNYSKVLKSIEQELPRSAKCDVLSISRTSGFISGLARYYSELPEFVEKLKKYELYSGVHLQSIGRQADKNAFAPFTYKITFNLNEDF